MIVRNRSGVDIKGILAQNFKRTKILATVGPATHSQEAIMDLIKEGVNCIRLNFSHGSHEDHAQSIEWVRQASKTLQKPVAIMQDLQGPKLRVGVLPDQGVQLKKGEIIKLDYGADYTKNGVIPTQHDFASKLKPRETIFLNDGRFRLQVTRIKGSLIETKVVIGGMLTSNKGINLPDTNFGGDILTAKDRTDIDFGLKHDIDYIAMSFVQNAKEIIQIKRILEQKKSSIGVVAKIETKPALDNLEQIIDVSDGVVIARGDLAIEAGLEVVPVIQQKILGLARKHCTFAVVATQMLSSMLDSPQPSRADVSDVATAVTMGTDAVWLSDETTVGKFPIETVKTMKRIILYTEQNSPVEPVFLNFKNTGPQDSIASAAITLAHQLKAKLIIAETSTGRNARTIASHRPQMPIVMPTRSRRVSQQLAIVYGGRSYHLPNSRDLSGSVIRRLKAAGSLRPGDYVVHTYGRHSGKIQGANTIRIIYIS
jgi:pyruvate kinase